MENSNTLFDIDLSKTSEKFRYMESEILPKIIEMLQDLSALEKEFFKVV